MHRLILFSGLPGCGKTTLARQVVQDLRCAYFAKDRIQRVLDDTINGAKPIHGYDVLLDLTDEHLALGVDVVLDAAFPMAGFRQTTEQMAYKYHAQFLPVWCVCSNENLWQERLADRVQYVPGWTPATLDKAHEVQAYFEPWDHPNILMLDAVYPIETNIARLREYLKRDGINFR